MFRCLRVGGPLSYDHHNDGAGSEQSVSWPSISTSDFAIEKDLQHTDTQQIKHAPTFQISASFGMGRTSDEISVFEADECTLSADPMQKHIQALPEQASAADCSAHNRNSEVRISSNKLTQCSTRLKALLQHKQLQRVAPDSLHEPQELKPVVPQKPPMFPSSAATVCASAPDSMMDTRSSLSAIGSYATVGGIPNIGSSSVYSYLNNHGRSIMAISAVQQGLQHFIVPGVGFIAYAMMYNGPPVLNIRTAVALGDPVCDPQQYQAMAQAFLKQHPKAMFAQISKAFALVLSSKGLLVNALGGETSLDVEKYSFSDYAKRGLRSAIASAQKEGHTVEEVMQAPLSFGPAADSGKGTAAPAGATAAAETHHGNWSLLAQEMREVDKLWVATKGKHASKVWFLNRQPVLAPEIGVRKFIARDSSGVLQAFIFLDAVYEGGHITGYYANVTRMRPEAHPGVLNLMIREVIDRLRCESNLAAPAKRISVKKSKSKKQQYNLLATSATEATDPAAPTTPPRTINIQCSSAFTSCAPTHSSSSSGGSTSSSMTDDTAMSRSSSGMSSSSDVTASGVKFLSLGMSPFCNLDDSFFNHSSRMRYWLKFAFDHGTVFYPAKSLAAAKAKYGAGLHNGRYKDPNVSYTQVYLAHSHHNNMAAALAVHDLLRLIGMWKHPIDTVTSYLKHKIKRRDHRAQQRQQRAQQPSQQQKKPAADRACLLRPQVA